MCDDERVELKSVYESIIILCLSVMKFVDELLQDTEMVFSIRLPNNSGDP